MVSSTLRSGRGWGPIVFGQHSAQYYAKRSDRIVRPRRVNLAAVPVEQARDARILPLYFLRPLRSPVAVFTVFAEYKVVDRHTHTHTHICPSSTPRQDRKAAHIYTLLAYPSPTSNPTLKTNYSAHDLDLPLDHLPQASNPSPSPSDELTQDPHLTIPYHTCNQFPDHAHSTLTEHP